MANEIIAKQLDFIKTIIYPDGFEGDERNNESANANVADVEIKKDKNLTNSLNVVGSPNNPIKKIRLTLPLSKNNDSPIQRVPPVPSSSPLLKHKTPEKLKLSPQKIRTMTEYLTPNRKPDVNSPRNLMESTKLNNTHKATSDNKNPSSKISPVKPKPSPFSVASTSTTSISSSSKQPPSKPPPNQIRNFPKIEDVFKVVAPKGLMAKKLENAAPYNFFLTTISDSKPTHSEPLSVTFQELLDPSLGDLDSSIQINFMIDVGFLMAQYIYSGNENKPMVILYGQDSDDMKKIPTRYPEIAPIKIEMSAFATHHS